MLGKKNWANLKASESSDRDVDSCEAKAVLAVGRFVVFVEGIAFATGGAWFKFLRVK